ncbi:hypothetical protein ACLB2K_040172 [Fragaria x ananassa]
MPPLSKRSSTSKLPWQVVDLVSNHLDPKTLATACCVSKTWFTSISSDHIWQPICTTHFPSLSYNLKLVNPALPYYRLYAMASAAAKRRSRTPSKPSLALHDLIFTVNVFNHNKVLFSLEKPGDELVMDNNGVFKFNIDVDNNELEAVASESVSVTWNVVLKGWRGVFNMMESCKGKRGVDDCWFSEELPLPGCCLSLVDSGVVAELRLVFTEESKTGGNNLDHVGRINKVSVGMFSTAKLRYVGVDDGFRYLQHFLC